MTESETREQDGIPLTHDNIYSSIYLKAKQNPAPDKGVAYFGGQADFYQ